MGPRYHAPAQRRPTCDPYEVCDGSSTACPPDAKAPSGTSCGSAPTGPCDLQDTCDGGGQCLANIRPQGFICRPGGGHCNKPEVCDGSTGACPDNTFEWIQYGYCTKGPELARISYTNQQLEDLEALSGLSEALKEHCLSLCDATPGVKCCYVYWGGLGNVSCRADGSDDLRSGVPPTQRFASRCEP